MPAARTLQRHRSSENSERSADYSDITKHRHIDGIHPAALQKDSGLLRTSCCARDQELPAKRRIGDSTPPPGRPDPSQNPVVSPERCCSERLSGAWSGRIQPEDAGIDPRPLPGSHQPVDLPPSDACSERLLTRDDSRLIGNDSS